MGGGEGVVEGRQARRMGAAGVQGWRTLVAKHSSARGCRTELKSKSKWEISIEIGIKGYSSIEIEKKNL